MEVELCGFTNTALLKMWESNQGQLQYHWLRWSKVGRGGCCIKNQEFCFRCDTYSGMAWVCTHQVGSWLQLLSGQVRERDIIWGSFPVDSI